MVSALAEGASIRSIERMTGVNRNTIMSLGHRVGTGCESIMDTKMVNLPRLEVEVDEIWVFIDKNQKNVKSRDSRTLGDVWTSVALDANTKLIPAYLVGHRDRYSHRSTCMRREVPACGERGLCAAERAWSTRRVPAPLLATRPRPAPKTKNRIGRRLISGIAAPAP